MVDDRCGLRPVYIETSLANLRGVVASDHFPSRRRLLGSGFDTIYQDKFIDLKLKNRIQS